MIAVPVTQTIRCVMELEEPRVQLFHNFMSHDEADELIALSREKLRPSDVVDEATGEYVMHNDRSSEGTFFLVGANPLVTRLEARAAMITGIPQENCEGTQILHYRHGGEYKPHFDFFSPEHPGHQEILQRHGQRIVTMIFYLNTCPKGGETIFPKLGIKVRPVKGSALLFHNVDTEGNPMDLALHGGAPVLEGEKWIATKWMRDRPYV